MRQHAFTLIELLVVVAIIALLIAILMPSLQQARDTSRIVVCQSNQRQLVMANIMYANEQKEWYVPLSMPPKLDASTSWGTRWMQNSLYQAMLGARNDPTVWYGLSVWPRNLLCPNQPEDHKDQPWNMWRVYAYNRTDIPNQGSPTFVGYKRQDVHMPAWTGQLVDGADWHTQINKANYALWWDVYGEEFLPNYWQMVVYRHLEGANIMHFDGHGAYYRKAEAWVDGSTAANERLWKIIK